MARSKSKPCRKRNYKTKGQALKNLEQIKVLNMSKGNKEKKNKTLHVYECDKCHAWHVGHNTNFRKVLGK